MYINIIDIAIRLTITTNKFILFKSEAYYNISF